MQVARHIAFLLLLLPISLYADERAIPKLVVLEFKVDNRIISIDASATLANLVRSRIVQSMGGAIKLISKEKVIEILRASNKSAAQCTSECEVQTGREIGADYVLTGSVGALSGKAILVLDVKKSQDGVTAASISHKALPGELDDKLDEAVDRLAAELLQNLGRTKGGDARRADPPRSNDDSDGIAIPPPPVVGVSGPRVTKHAISAAVGDVTISAKPAGVVRMEIVDAVGKRVESGSPFKNPRAPIGDWHVNATAEGYEPESFVVNVVPDEPTLFKLELKPLAELLVDGSPIGSAVSVQGPKGFSDEGGLPWQASGLRSGTYRIEVSRAGYVKQTKDMEITPGQSARMQVNLQKGTSLGGVWKALWRCTSACDCAAYATFAGTPQTNRAEEDILWCADNPTTIVVQSGPATVNGNTLAWNANTAAAVLGSSNYNPDSRSLTLSGETAQGVTGDRTKPMTDSIRFVRVVHDQGHKLPGKWVGQMYNRWAVTIDVAEDLSARMASRMGSQSATMVGKIVRSGNKYILEPRVTSSNGTDYKPDNLEFDFSPDGFRLIGQAHDPAHGTNGPFRVVRTE